MAKAKKKKVHKVAKKASHHKVAKKKKSKK
jgi:hypothetical protein